MSNRTSTNKHCQACNETRDEIAGGAALVFKVRGMDCAEEVTLLKRELGWLLEDEAALAFDLVSGKMTVSAYAPAIARGDVGETELVQAVARTGLQAIPWQRWADAGVLRESFWARRGKAVLCAASGAVLLLCMGFHGLDYLCLELRADAESAWVYLLIHHTLCAMSIVAGGWYIFPKAVRAARRFRPDMNLLMTVAVLGAVGIGEWFEAATVTFLFALALLLESWSVGRARNAVASLLELAPATARFRRGETGSIEERPVAEVPIGATVLVRPGEKIPLDGVVVKGASSVNQAPITGESLPASKGVGDEVFAGSLNIEGAFEFRVTKLAQDTTLARIIQLIEQTQSRRAPTERWVERFALYYTPLMMILALLVVLVPPLAAGAPWKYSFYQGLVILVIACPCAMVISTPVCVVAGLATAARAGVLIKGGLFLEVPATLKAVAMDKTGTLTYGRPEVQQILPLNRHSEQELLAHAAALESHSDHPLAQAIVRKAKERRLSFEPALSFTAAAGEGGYGVIGGHEFWIGSYRMLLQRGGAAEEFQRRAAQLQDAGHSVVVMGTDDHVCGLISLADAIRPEAAEAVTKLKQAGIDHVVLLTGDNEGTARAVAEAVNVDDYRFGLRPEDKVEFIKSLERQYGRVAMVGDGVNDAPALGAATVGIAMGAAGTDTAIETADIALMADDLNRIPWLVRHSRRTRRTIRQNIVVALATKGLFLVLTGLGVASLWMAIAADMGASLAVIANALRLLKEPAARRASFQWR